MELTVAITGASGAIYAHRTLIHLASSGVVQRINLIISDSARTVANGRIGIRFAFSRRAENQRMDRFAERGEDGPDASAGQHGGDAVVGIASASRHDHRAVLDG